MEVDQLTRLAIGAAIKVHRALGPGLLESTYERCTMWELERLGLKVEHQKTMPLRYGQLQIESGYRLDLIVDDQLIMELKSVERLSPVHSAQMLTYLKLSGCPVGLLINFNVPMLRDGIRRFVLDLPEEPRRPPRTLRPPR
jgi:GxxExxY protein